MDGYDSMCAVLAKNRSPLGFAYLDEYPPVKDFIRIRFAPINCCDDAKPQHYPKLRDIIIKTAKDAGVNRVEQAKGLFWNPVLIYKN